MIDFFNKQTNGNKEHYTLHYQSATLIVAHTVQHQTQTLYIIHMHCQSRYVCAHYIYGKCELTRLTEM